MAVSFEFDPCISDPDKSLEENDALCRAQHQLVWELRRLPKGKAKDLARLVQGRPYGEFLYNDGLVNQAVRLALGGRTISDAFLDAHFPHARIPDFLIAAWDASGLEKYLPFRDRLVPTLHQWVGGEMAKWMDVAEILGGRARQILPVIWSAYFGKSTATSSTPATEPTPSEPATESSPTTTPGSSSVPGDEPTV